MSNYSNMDRVRQNALRKVKETKKLRSLGEKRQGARNFSRDFMDDCENFDDIVNETLNQEECENESLKS